MDLFVWLDDNDEIVSYQLTYDKPNDEKALLWKKQTGFSHLGVDDGARPGKHPASPLLVEDGAFVPDRIVSALKDDRGELTRRIKNFVVSGIETYFK